MAKKINQRKIKKPLKKRIKKTLTTSVKRKS